MVVGISYEYNIKHLYSLYYLRSKTLTFFISFSCDFTNNSIILYKNEEKHDTI